MQSGTQWIVIHVLCGGIVYLQKEPSKFLSNSMELFKKASNILGHPNFGFMTKLNRDFIMNITISLIP